MFQIHVHDLIMFFLTFFGGGGIGWLMVRLYIKSEAKAALKETIGELKKEDGKLHSRINHVEDNFVQCKYCEMQHSNLERTLNSMDVKLDILIQKKSGD